MGEKDFQQLYLVKKFIKKNHSQKYDMQNNKRIKIICFIITKLTIEQK